jgi:hypothetical protein
MPRLANAKQQHRKLILALFQCLSEVVIRMKKLSTIFFICFVGQQTYGQTPSISTLHFRKAILKSRIDSIEESLEEKSQFQLQSSYTNKVIFAGRDFGVKQFGATLGVAYHHKSGFNLEYNGNYWSAMDNRFALSDIGGYYEKSLLKNLYLSGGYWRLFYTNGDKEERSVFTNFFMIDESWYTSLGLLNLSYYYIKGDEQAHRLDINVSHPIELYHFLHADKLCIEPTFIATFATINYFVWLSSLAEITSNVNEDTFTVGNYEFVLPVTYKKLGKFEIRAAWNYALPVSIVREEEVHPVSYFTLNITRMFLFKSSTK